MTALEALNLAAPIADAYTSVEERLLVQIARQISLNDDHQLNEVSRWQIKQLAKHGIAKSRVRVSDDAIREMLTTEGAFLLQCAVTEKDYVLPMTPPGANVDEMLLEIKD